jgi:aspartate kinase
VANTRKIDQLSFLEAAELAYFGAKILHPQTVLPARVQNIPVRLKNTMNPSDSGTLITADSDGTGIKAVAAKDGITAIKIRSGRMLMAYGFLKNVFAVFEKYKNPD